MAGLCVMLVAGEASSDALGASLARALKAFGQDSLTDAGGKAHAWKQELRAQLFSMQQADGSWSNLRHSRWTEDMPELVTAYALLTLAETK